MAAHIELPESGLAAYTTSSPIPYLVEAGYPTQRGISYYYTNRIEGQHTFPLDIQRALKGAYARDPYRARRQRLALAHRNR